MGPGGRAGDPSDDPPRRTRPSGVDQRLHRLRSLMTGALVALVLASLLVWGLAGHPAPKGRAGVGVGSEAPDFTLPSLTGGPPVHLDALGRDRHHPVVLNFFASWCVPCQQETPTFAATASAERAAGSDVQFVGVDVADPPADAVPFVRGAGVTYPVGADATFAVSSSRYGLDGQPNTFFIAPPGHVIGHVEGAVSRAELLRWIDRLRAGPT